jgi:hypothetical protein
LLVKLEYRRFSTMKGVDIALLIYRDIGDLSPFDTLWQRFRPAWVQHIVLSLSRQSEQ